MKVVFYRSNDINIRRNSQFTQNIVDRYQDHQSLKVSITMEEDKNKSFKEIEDADLIFIFSHGNEYATFHKLQTIDGKERPDFEHFITRDKDIDRLRDKKVLVFACFTAIEYVGLADAAIENGCNVYLGFADSINRNLPDSIAEQLAGKIDIDVKDFISSVYSKVFERAIVRAIEENYTFAQFSTLLKFSLNTEMTKRILNFKDLASLDYLMEAAIPVQETADAIIIKGNDSIRFVS